MGDLPDMQHANNDVPGTGNRKPSILIHPTDPARLNLPWNAWQQVHKDDQDIQSNYSSRCSSVTSRISSARSRTNSDGSHMKISFNEWLLSKQEEQKYKAFFKLHQDVSNQKHHLHYGEYKRQRGILYDEWLQIKETEDQKKRQLKSEKAVQERELVQKHQARRKLSQSQYQCWLETKERARTKLMVQQKIQHRADWENKQQVNRKALAEKKYNEWLQMKHAMELSEEAKLLQRARQRKISLQVTIQPKGKPPPHPSMRHADIIKEGSSVRAYRTQSCTMVDVVARLVKNEEAGNLGAEGDKARTTRSSSLTDTLENQPYLDIKTDERLKALPQDQQIQHRATNLRYYQSSTRHTDYTHRMPNDYSTVPNLTSNMEKLNLPSVTKAKPSETAYKPARPNARVA